MNKLMKSDPQRVLSCSLRPKDLFHSVALEIKEENVVFKN